jgi:WD40 repeat protein
LLHRSGDESWVQKRTSDNHPQITDRVEHAQVPEQVQGHSVPAEAQIQESKFAIPPQLSFGRMARTCTSVPLVIKEDSPEGDVSVRIWDAMTNELLWEGSNPLSRFACYCPDSKKVYFTPCRSNRSLTVFDVNTGEAKSLFVALATRRCCEAFVSRSGMRIGVIVRDSTGPRIGRLGFDNDGAYDLEIWDAQTGDKLFTVYDTVYDATSRFCFSGDDTHFITINENHNNIMHIYDSGTGSKLHAVSSAFDGTPAGMVASLNGTMCAVYGVFGQGICIWGVQTGTLILRKPEKVTSCCFGVDDTSMICFHLDRLTAWRIEDNSVMFERFAHGGYIVFSAASHMIYCLRQTWTRDGATNIVYQFNAVDGDEVAVSEVYTSQSMFDIVLCFPPFGNILL